MKKFISVCLCAVMILMSVCAYAAEDFQLRNGILFGDTLDIVKSKETLPMEEDSEEKTDKVWFKGTIAGMDGSVRFDFDESTGGLTDMLYSFSSMSSRDSLNSDYKTLYQSLVRKYGTPLGNTGGSLHIITGPAIENAATMVALYAYLLEGDGDFVDYDEWIVESNGYKVKIDLISYYTRDKSFNYNYGICASYHKFTDEDLENAIQEKQSANDAVDNDM